MREWQSPDTLNSDLTFHVDSLTLLSPLALFHLNLQYWWALSYASCPGHYPLWDHVSVCDLGSNQAALLLFLVCPDILPVTAKSP